MTIYSELEAVLAQAKALARALNALNKTKSLVNARETSCQHSGDLALQESIAAFEVWRNCTDEAAWYAPDDFEQEEEK